MGGGHSANVTFCNRSVDSAGHRLRLCHGARPHRKPTMTVKTYTPDSSIGKRLSDVQRIKLEIDRLNEQLDEHKAYLLGHAIRNDYTTLQLGALKISRRERAFWSYSEALQDAEAKLKDRKVREQKNGTATNTPTEHLVINFSVKAILLDKVEA